VVVNLGILTGYSNLVCFRRFSLPLRIRTKSSCVIDNAHVHLLCMEVDSTVIMVLILIEFHQGLLS
jgi:hypothetical protein